MGFLKNSLPLIGTGIGAAFGSPEAGMMAGQLVSGLMPDNSLKKLEKKAALNDLENSSTRILANFNPEGSGTTMFRKKGGFLSENGALGGKFIGNKHSQGGIQFGKAEVEGGETYSPKYNYVFSNVIKDIDGKTFADKHSSLSKSVSKMLEKPLNDITKKSITKSLDNEKGLIERNEIFKEIDNTNKLAEGGFVLEDILPYASNILGSFMKPPKVPTPSLTSYVRPNEVSFDSGRKDISDSLNNLNLNLDATGNSAVATRSKMSAFSKVLDANSRLTEQETNTNAQINNDNNRLNTSIEQSNNQTLNQFKMLDVERQIADQQFKMDNLANASDKFSLSKQDQARLNLDEEKWQEILKRFNPNIVDKLYGNKSSKKAVSKAATSIMPKFDSTMLNGYSIG